MSIGSSGLKRITLLPDKANCVSGVLMDVKLIRSAGKIARWGRRALRLSFWLALMAAMPGWAQVYKWTDAEGQVHYGNRPPPSDGRSPQTLDISSKPSPAGEVDNVRDLERARRELRELRAANRGVPVNELDRAPKKGKSSRTKESPSIGYADQSKIENLNRDIHRLSGSTIGTPDSRARELRAARDELRQIYRKYGIKPP